MVMEQVVGSCRQFSGKLNEALGELTGNPCRVINGRRSQLAGRSQQLSGIEKNNSARQIHWL